MNDGTLVWSKRIAGWAALFFFATAVAPSLLIGYVVAFGQRLKVDPNEITCNPYTSGLFKNYWRAVITYHYVQNNMFYSGSIDIEPDKFNSDHPPGTPLYYPFEPGEYRKLDIMIWEALPQFSIPLIPEYQPLTKTIPLWIMAIIATLTYLRYQKLFCERKKADMS